MTGTQLRHIASQLRALLDEMKSIKLRTLGSVTGGPFRNQYFFPYVLEPHSEILRSLPCHSAIRFSHGDLVPRNIFVDGSTITGVVYWAMAGFYPEFWEYCRMHEDGSTSPNWDKVLDLVFPMPRRISEVNAVSHLFSVLTHNY
ncbi:hypothetical protein F5146DRAFT_1207880 [Armillaria mellea]|nr:hypothetical protein F5146DRAFT_1207880 [Armillaria mellea]